MGDFLIVVSLVAFVALVAMLVRLTRASVTPTRRSRRWIGWAALTWVGAFLLSVFTSPPTSYSPPAPGADGSPQMSVAGYRQTWPKAYTATTCDDFDTEMTSSQQFAAAADMLTLVWRKIETSTDIPGESVIQEYRDEVESHCDTPTEAISEVAWSVWINDPRFAS